MKRILTTLALTFVALNFVYAQYQGEIRGQLKDESGNPVPLAAVVVYSGDRQVGAAQTNFDGIYIVKPLSPGVYTVKIQHMSYQPYTISNVEVGANQSKYIDQTLATHTHGLPPIIIEAPGDAIIDKSKTWTGQTLKSAEIAHSINRDVKDFAATTPGVVQKDEGGSLNIRGSREDATQYVIDGIKVIGGFSLPKSAIQEITVITGGIPASFGDATGGIVLITTKGFIGR